MDGGADSGDQSKDMCLPPPIRPVPSRSLCISAPPDSLTHLPSSSMRDTSALLRAGTRLEEWSEVSVPGAVTP